MSLGSQHWRGFSGDFQSNTYKCQCFAPESALYTEKVLTSYYLLTLTYYYYYLTHETLIFSRTGRENREWCQLYVLNLYVLSWTNGKAKVTKLTIEDVSSSDTPYLDVFGVEVRKRGRPEGSLMDYSTSLHLPPEHKVPNREAARKMRARVEQRSLRILKAVMGEELKKIYTAELKLELERVDPDSLEGSEDTNPAKKPVKRLSMDDAKKLPGSGLLEGETYHDWMKTFNDKDDDQWKTEKAKVIENIRRLMKGIS